MNTSAKAISSGSGGSGIIDDASEMTEQDFARGRVIHPKGWKGRETVAVPFDIDVVEWFKAHYGDAYGFYLNAVLRNHMINNRDSDPPE